MIFKKKIIEIRKLHLVEKLYESKLYELNKDENVH